ncbi:hypothetical protein ATO8_03011 [Roseivivax marinus]|uniref:Uncharacterized protein n=1 Tax=Roseivivax marinus TaxID=1379903 RepID=W4HNX1_9RHOB|nr:hypothetical protein [Roseivivax marinus]ETW13826.1 hypothetical protein ATO8_03011 [Roseivivax marinus]
MKALIAAAALAATAVAAVPAAAQISDEAAQIKIEKFAPEVDVTRLTDAQIQSLLNVIHSGGGRGDREATAQSLVRAYQ